MHYELITDLVKRAISTISSDFSVEFMSPALIDDGLLLHGVVAYDRFTSHFGEDRTYVVHGYAISADGSKASLHGGEYDLSKSEALEKAFSRADTLFPRYRSKGDET